MASRNELLSRGVFERAVSLFGTLVGRDKDPRGPAEIKPDSAAFERAVESLRQEFRINPGVERRLFNELMDGARRSVNAARRFNREQGDPESPALRNVPCRERPGGRCEGNLEVRGFVELYDPETGAKQRVPVILSLYDSPTRSDIASRMALLAFSAVESGEYSKDGMLDPTRAVQGTVVISAIYSRD